MPHLLCKNNGSKRFRKEHSTEEGARTRKDHHNPKDPAPSEMTSGDTTEKTIRRLRAPQSHQNLQATDNRPEYRSQEHAHREYACRDAAGAWVPNVGDDTAAIRQGRAGKEAGEKAHDDDSLHILRQSLAEVT